VSDEARFTGADETPVAASDAQLPPLRWSRRGEGRLRALIGQTRRMAKGPRLAYLDNHLPARRSGFFRSDALAFHALRPDTVFFSMYEMRDPFPAPVVPLAEFPRVAPTVGITDVYGVGLDFMAAIVGLGAPGAGARPDVIKGLDLSSVIRRDGLRVYACVGVAGGSTAIDSRLARVRSLVGAVDQVFDWSPLVTGEVDGVIPILPAVIETGYYQPRGHNFDSRPLEILFVADVTPPTGLDVALRMMVELDSEPVHLHVVGPHDPRVLGGDRATFHGSLERDELRALHRRCNVFVSPMSSGGPDDAGGDGEITDGFPTGAAAEAMSSGLLLISVNPDADCSQLRPDIDFLERLADPFAFAEAVREVIRNPARAATIAATGARRVRERFDVRVGVAERLALMNLDTQASRAVARRPAGGPELDGLRREVTALTRAVSDLRDAHQTLAAAVDRSHGELMEVAESLVDGEGATRTELLRARAGPGYEAAFTDADPLVSICVPTYRNLEALLTRSLPSLLAQEHRNIEVIVVGDDAPAATGEAIAAIGDPRVRYENLRVRGPYPDDPEGLWFVAGTGPLNRALELARGEWVAINNDDDALRPDHVSVLLAEAQRSRDEVVYGQLLRHTPDGGSSLLGSFPPVSHGFGWQLALQHRAMRMFDFKLTAALFREPGDWNRARRMLRAGVRFRMIDRVVCDYYPGKLWRAQ
jgi:glycosyltransferase involved in cell wall biosynthesis